jgi:hypothetical protein
MRPILDSREPALTAHHIGYSRTGLLSKVTNVKTINSAIDLGWHEDQLHRIGNGKEPDLDRSKLKTAGALMRRNGRDAFKKKRS